MLNSIEIKNFRGIKHLTIDNFKNINIFLGKANTGKTSVIEAIECGITKNINSLILLSYFRDAIRDDYIFESLFYDYNINIPIILYIKINNKDYKIEISPHKHNREIIISDDKTEEIYNTELNKLIYKISNNGKTRNYVIAYSKKDKKINFRLGNAKIDFNVDFISGYVSEDFSSNLKSILSNNKKKEQFKSLYTKFDNRIKDIIFIENKVAVELVNLTHAINIKSMGKGFQTYLKIIASMVAGNKYIIIDEIENGMHFESIKILLENILSLSKEYNLQFFVTTHNKELLEILNNILDENNYDDMLSVYNTYINNENNIDIVNYTQENFSHFIENDNEMRD
ncbi:AAA family ATPase [Brachyspira hyodysenteriae]|uniref:AAA family ATPase n=1 Tax=Brachyspira hyodysenteriae TaxID=159 RepID=UPI00063D9300|nr:AAA family ATPase [Brachyspira hyodysenteriae]KLI23698.1 hypothetical protein SU43_06190 [Brachyspira hyodysenteriae]TVL56709.1 hypothetical protein A9X86_04720 [Brachyspira hyodysenteriae]